MFLYFICSLPQYSLGQTIQVLLLRGTSSMGHVSAVCALYIWSTLYWDFQLEFSFDCALIVTGQCWWCVVKCYLVYVSSINHRTRPLESCFLLLKIHGYHDALVSKIYFNASEFITLFGKGIQKVRAVSCCSESSRLVDCFGVWLDDPLPCLNGFLFYGYWSCIGRWTPDPNNADDGRTLTPWRTGSD